MVKEGPYITLPDLGLNGENPKYEPPEGLESMAGRYMFDDTYRHTDNPFIEYWYVSDKSVDVTITTETYFVKNPGMKDFFIKNLMDTSVSFNLPLN